MATTPITITQKTKKRFRVEIDRNSFERLADSLGLFRSEFLESLDCAEHEIKSGHVKKLKRLRDLRS